MNIAILQGPCLPIPPLKGGAVEKLWYALGQQFAEKGHKVTHISRTWQGLANSERLGGVHHVRIRGFDANSKQFVNKALDFGYALRAATVIPRDCDLVVTNTFWAPIVLSLRSRAAIYVSVERMPKGQMRFYRGAARLRAPSGAVARAIANELPENDKARISLIPNLYHSMHTTSCPLICHSRKSPFFTVAEYMRRKDCIFCKNLSPSYHRIGG